MTIFWVICAAFVMFALAFILPPIFQGSEESDRESEDERRNANIAVYRDQLTELEADVQNGIMSEDQYAQDRDEIERRLLEDTSSTIAKPKAKTVPASARSTAYAIAIGLPVVAVVFYLNVGNPKAITNEAVPTQSSNRSSAAPGPQERTQEQIEANVAALAKRLQENPSDVQGWTMLARSYNSMNRFGESAGAYAKATELSPKDADLWAEYAFAAAMAGGRSLEGRPTELIEKALQVDPNNVRALQLAGSAAFQAKDYKKAVSYWERVLKQVPPNSEVTAPLTERINEAKKLAAGK